MILYEWYFLIKTKSKTALQRRFTNMEYQNYMQKLSFFYKLVTKNPLERHPIISFIYLLIALQSNESKLFVPKMHSITSWKYFIYLIWERLCRSLWTTIEAKSQSNGLSHSKLWDLYSVVQVRTMWVLWVLVFLS